MADEATSRAKTIIERKRESARWMEANFYDQWEETYRNYKGEMEPFEDADGNEDDEQSAIGSPMTWGYIRRLVARGTAQPPNLRFHCKAPAVGELISRTLMYQWDKAKIQRWQKKHFLQAALFGWSVRNWYWLTDEKIRTKRIDPLAGQLTPEVMGQIASTYGLDEMALADPMQAQQAIQGLLAEKSRGRLLPVKYTYKVYEGPKCDFLFVGDCYPEPNFESVQTSGWFIVERRRRKDWLETVAKSVPELAAGIQELLTRYPKGTPISYSDRDSTYLKDRLLEVLDRETSDQTNTFAQQESVPTWLITEQHIPGDTPRVAYVGGDDVFLGEIDYPYDLDGQIAFTECVLIDDLLSGVGDSTARIMRGLHQMHEQQWNKRYDLISNILRPLIGTSNQALLDNPNLIKRHSGFRMVYLRGPGEMWVQGEQAAMASAAASLQDEAGLFRLFQMLTGESNMSMAANVDPSQNRTATGVRAMAYNQDVLTKDLNDMFSLTSLTADAEMMYLLNRSELTEAIEFEPRRYNRNYTQMEDPIRGEWVKVEPLMFQIDGEIIAEAGSTLADDDDTRVTRADGLYSKFAGNPTVNQEKLRDEVLVANNKGRELQAWASPPPQPPPPPEVRTTVTVSARWVELTPEERQKLMEKAGIQVSVEPPPPGAGAEGPMPPPMPGPPGGPPPAPPPMAGEPLIAGQAFAAAKGRPVQI